jgi:hypothetical protein
MSAVGTTAASPADGTNIRAIYGWSGYAAYKHQWNECLRSNLILSYAKASNRDEESLTMADRAYGSVHLNLMWNPIPTLRLGAELIHMTHKQNGDERKGNMNRLNLAAKWSFA